MSRRPYPVVPDGSRIVIDKTQVLIVTADGRSFLRPRSRRSGHVHRMRQEPQEVKAA